MPDDPKRTETPTLSASKTSGSAPADVTLKALRMDTYPPELAQLGTVDAGATLLRKGVGLAESEALVKYGLPVITTAQELAESYIQQKNAFYDQNHYYIGMNDKLKQGIASYIPRLPDTATPTNVGLFVGETVNDFDYESRLSGLVHGYETASIAETARRALGDDDKPAILLNRTVMADKAGKHKTRPENYDSSYTPDKAQESIRQAFHTHTFNVVSISAIGPDTPLKDRESYGCLLEKLDQQYGNNTLYVIASNNFGRGTSLRHNVVHSHPSRALIVGAMHEQEKRIGDASYPVAFVAHYSEPGADIVMPVPRLDTGYNVLEQNILKPDTLTGTSFAAPAAAAGTARLIERFARSKENPAALLSPETILLAIKQTARPVTADGNALMPQVPIDGRRVTSKAGNGRADFKEAWKLLERMERRVRDTQAADKDGAAMPAGLEKAYVRERLELAPVILRPEKHVRNDQNPQLFEYELPMQSPLYADNALVHFQSPMLSNSRRFDKGTAIAVLPDGQQLELNASPHNDSEVHYLIAKIPGVQGIPINGKWKILSSEKLEEVALSFPNAMQKDDVGVVVKPPRRPVKELYQHADLRHVPPEALDKEFFGKDFSAAEYDFSTTAFPESYLETRLVDLLERSYKAKQDKDTRAMDEYLHNATRLIDTGYGGLQNRPVLLAAIQKRDPLAAIHSLSTLQNETAPPSVAISAVRLSDDVPAPVPLATPATTQPSGTRGK